MCVVKKGEVRARQAIRLTHSDREKRIVNMKSLSFIAVLAALTVCNDAASILEEGALSQEQAALFAEDGFVYREDTGMYQKGDVRVGDHLFYDHTCHVPAIPNAVQFEDVVYLGNSTTRITGLRMSNVPVTPGTTMVGPLGAAFLSIRLRSAPGDGIFTRVQFWGHYTDWV
ncbi:hypothetical protein PYW08_009256 [Mythimna loreyi]|uniref:Uncharacterized protein n=1 Tax=Mythimna loreyi TaxID=667449 RepID=A0ACC2Q8Y6_9NEOP|nr:hypothetical protein PYW08_009256 [Mythimna loreyi]